MVKDRSDDDPSRTTVCVPIARGGLPAGTPVTHIRSVFSRKFEAISGTAGKHLWNNFDHVVQTVKGFPASVSRSSGPFGSSSQYYSYYGQDQASSWDQALMSVPIDKFQLPGRPFWPSLDGDMHSLFVFGNDISSGLRELVVIPPRSVTDTAIELVRALLPGIRQEAQVLNDLVDLRSTKSSVVKTLDSARRLALAVGGRSIREFLRSLIHYASGAYLQWVFDIRPTAQDVVLIYKRLGDIDQQLAKLNADQRKYLVKHAVRDLPNLYPDGNFHFEGLAIDGTNYQGESIRREVEHRNVKVHVTIDYAYRLDDIPQSQQRVRALRDALGININPNTIWNAIPWSFVVDWLVKVDKFLSEISGTAIDPKVLIYNCCYSFSCTRTVRGFYHGGKGSPDDNGEQQVAEVETQVYCRTNLNPSSTVLRASGLSPSEVGIGAFLAGNKLTRRRR